MRGGIRFMLTVPSKRAYFIVIIMLLILFLIDRPFIASVIGGMYFSYILKPILWASTFIYVWLLPNSKPKVKIRFKNIIYAWAFNFGILYIGLIIIAGLFDGFGKSPYSHTFIGIALNILLVGIMLIAREYVRDYLINSFTKKVNYVVFGLITLLMTVTSVPFNSYVKITGLADGLLFIAINIIPALGQNILATFLVYLGGPISSIIYLGTLYSFNWLSPILPNLKWITNAFIGIIYPIFALAYLQNIYYRSIKKIKGKNKKKENFLEWMLIGSLSVLFIWFVIGIFPIYPSVIVTGSMEPVIYPGDVTLVKKFDGKNINLGEIIQFKRGDIVVCHRVIKKTEAASGILYRTKGDNNSSEDMELVSPKQIKGKVIKVIPKIGWLTLLLKSKENIPIKEIVF